MAITAYGRGRLKQTIHLKDEEFKHFSACGHSTVASVDMKHAFLVDCKKCLKKIEKAGKK